MKKKISKSFYISITCFIFIVLCSLFFFKDQKSALNNMTYVKENEKLPIYVFNENNYISKTSVVVYKENEIDRINELIETMIEGNNKNNLLNDNFLPILPGDTKILSVKIINNIIRVDLTGSIKDLLNEQMVEALTYTLTEFENILGIELYINNKIVKYIPTSNKKLPSIITKDIGINKSYNLSNINEVNKVTIYYIGNNSDDIYYIPVTKYLNDKREKIEIIIDELSSNYIYEPNLMSFLNSNVRLISYELKDRSLELIFNEMFFNENIEKSVLEEVIYTISYSVFDNYDIEEVIFYVNDLEIAKKNIKNIE